jgi:putative membrane-bound dehydrogenase-like protein
VALALLALRACLLAQEGGPALRGGDAERRFPPLKLPEGFRATLFACDPLIEYPSVLALGPRPGSILLAYDYMTGLGTEIVRRDEIRIVEDTDKDGYADTSTLFASGFHSIQGLAYLHGRVLAMHAPLLTSLRDADGDGAADERRDLLAGLGWPPEKCPDRLHCANGVVAGHDGWLYLALGDRGCDVARPEGDRLVLEGGGILRCRPDGRDLHVFATGLRNIYDVALDEDLDVFVRDNENDGGTYKVRVYRSFFGADHGYPYLYEVHPDEALAPLVDVGLGSSAGGACYLEAAFPPDYRGDLFFCEWGRSIVRYRREHAGSGFAPMKEIEFASGGDADPYGFKPTDVIVDRDGSLLVADWGDGQRPKRGRGRVYRIQHGDPKRVGPEQVVERSLDAWIDQLGAGGQNARLEAQAAIEGQGEVGLKAVADALGAGGLPGSGRLHAVWILARGDARVAVDGLLSIAETDTEPRVRAQAVRAIADLADPVLVEHRLRAGHGDAGLARRLAVMGGDRDPRVLLEVVLAIGRLRWAEAPRWIAENVTRFDSDLSHGAMQTLRRAESWPATLELLDAPAPSPLHALALRAVAETTDPAVAAGLIERLRKEVDASRRLEYAGALARIQRRPGPWVYWGFRPGSRPANTGDWEWSDPIASALNEVLADPDHGVRAAVLGKMRRENVPLEAAALARWLHEERDPDRVASVLESLGDAPWEEGLRAAAEVAAGTAHAAANRITAVGLLARAGPTGRLRELAESLEGSVVLAEAMRQLAKLHEEGCASLLLRGLESPAAEVREAAAECLAELDAREAGPAVIRLLEDADVTVRRAAAAALGRLGTREAAGALLRSATDIDSGVRGRSLDALRGLKEPRAAPIARAALKDRESVVAAIRCLGEVGGPEHALAVEDVAAKERSLEILAAATRALDGWSAREPASRAALDEAIARLQGASGVILRWRTGTAPAESAPGVIERIAAPGAVVPPDWRTALAAGLESSVTLATPGEPVDGVVALACSDVLVAEAAAVQVLASSSGALEVWIDGHSIYRRDEPAAFRPDADRFDADLAAGTRRILVQVAGAVAPKLHLHFRRRSPTSEHERLTQLALTTNGDAERGRAVLVNEKSACLKCHRLGGEGGTIGPELTGVGRRFSRIHIVESILEPSRAIADSFQGHAVQLRDGRVLIGVKAAETDTTITLGDREGTSHVIAKSEVDGDESLALSIMPEGLEKALTDQELIDLIAFLESQK